MEASVDRWLEDDHRTHRLRFRLPAPTGGAALPVSLALWEMDAPLRGGKGDVHEGGIRVPAMISYPGKIPAGQTRDQIVTIMDWFPTVLDFCGIKQAADAPKLDGHSMTSVIADAQAASTHDVLHFAWANHWAVRKGDPDSLNFLNNWIQNKQIDGWLAERQAFWFQNRTWRDQLAQ